jgi:integrase
VVTCDLGGITPHSLRHTYAALAVQAGANVKVLQKAMGHSDIRLTLDTYGGLFGDDLDALAQRMDEAAVLGSFTKNGSSVVPLLASGN